MRRITFLALMLGVGCASASGAVSPTDSAPSKKTRVFLHFGGPSVRSYNITPANLRLYVVQASGPDASDPYLLVCSTLDKSTGTRLRRSSCRGAEESYAWVSMYESLAARALRRALDEGTIDLSQKTAILNITRDIQDLNLMLALNP